MQILVTLLGLLLVFSAHTAHSACEVIPFARATARGAGGSVSPPYGIPGEFVEFSLDSPCHADATGFPSADAEDYLVTIAFTPPEGRPTIVTLASDFDAVWPSVQTCGNQLDVHAAAVDPAASADFASSVALLEPVGDLTPEERAKKRHLRFRFPITSYFFGNASFTATGSSRIAVSLASDPFPCSLATVACADQAGLVACVDDLYREDGNCGTETAPVFPGFTGLPVPNDFAQLCTGSPCTPPNPTPHLRAAVDSDGNLLVPMDWSRVLVDREIGDDSQESRRLPATRLVRAALTVDAFSDAPGPILLEDPSSLSSWAPNGARLPPLFEPQLNVGEDPTIPILFGSVDAPMTVLRIKRCESQPGCTPGAFEFRDRFAPSFFGDAIGPVLIEGLEGVEALDPVAVDGILQTLDLNIFLKEEELIAADRTCPDPTDESCDPTCVAEADLNGDGDCSDPLLTVGDRHRAQDYPVGTNMGRALARIRQHPFSFSAIATSPDHNVIAFLEPEPLEGDCTDVETCDQNGDGDVFDTILRVLQLPDLVPLNRTEAPAAVEELALEDLLGERFAVDPEPKIDHESLRFSGGKLFFRYSEPANAPRVRENLGLPGEYVLRPALSGNGRWAVYSPVTAANLQIYLEDLWDPGAPRTLISRTPSGGAPNGRSTRPDISPNGRFVVFMSLATDLTDDGEEAPGVFIFDREAPDGAVERIGNTLDLPTFGFTLQASVSDEGRFVTFESWGEKPCCAYLRDRETQTTQPIVPVGEAGTTEGDNFWLPVISGNGRYVAFLTDASLTPDDNFDGSYDIYVKDRVTAEIARVSIDPEERDSQGNAAPVASPIEGEGQNVAISHTGRWVSWSSYTSGRVYIHDRDVDADGVFDEEGASSTALVSVASDGSIGDGESSSWTETSGNGRFTIFNSRSSNLVAETVGPPGNAIAAETYIRDNLTGLTAKVSQEPTYTRRWGANLLAISGDGWSHLRRVGVDPPWTIVADRPAPDGDDVTGDGDSLDILLGYLDVEGGGPRTTLCPALDVATNDGAVAFLRPEASGGAPNCPVGQPIDAGVDLNGDGDADDLVVHYWDGSQPVENLPQSFRPGIAATALALSDDAIVALVPESGEGRGSLNGDADEEDQVVHVYSFATRKWWSTGEAGIGITLRGQVLAFLMPEAAQGGLDLNGDGDTRDRVLRVYNVGGREQPTLLLGGALPVEDFVLGGRLGQEVVAFRVPEPGTNRRFLQIFDLASGETIETGQTAIPCVEEACNPRAPYRVLEDSVLFQTRESEQNADLNGDRDLDDDVLHFFNVRQAHESAAPDQSLACLDARSNGICSNSGLPCVKDEECDCVGTEFDCGCFKPPGRCLLEIENKYCGGLTCFNCQYCPSIGCTDCDLPPDPPAMYEPPDSFHCPCNEGEVCRLLTNCADDECRGLGICHTAMGGCTTDADCDAPARCVLERQDYQRLPNPFRPSASGGGGGLFVGSGAGALVPRAIRDLDLDEVPDAFDNCPDWPNVLQADSDYDRVGDACDSQLCSAARTVSRAAVGVSGLGRAPGFQRYTFAGEFRLSTEEAALLDPMQEGVQIILQDLTQAGTPLVELSHRTSPVPGGPTGCSVEGRDGWRTNRRGTRFSYRNRSDALPDAGCVPGSARGLRSIRITKEDQGFETVIRFRVRFVRATAPGVQGPLRGTIAIGTEAADLGLACAASFLPASQCKRGAGSISCKETAIVGLTSCGDGVTNGIEICDGRDLRGEDCTTQGLRAGPFGCMSDCGAYDTSECGGACVQGDAPLDPATDPSGCVGMVCGPPFNDTYCCTTEWDGLCVNEAEQLLECACIP